MKKILLLVCIFLAGKVAVAQYRPVDQGSSLKFTISNFGFDVPGAFSGFKGSITFDPQNLTNAAFDVTVDAGTVNTDNTMRDDHLREEGYFDVKNYPNIRLASTKITGKSGSFVLTGLLTIKGRSKEISFPFTASRAEDGYQFKGSFKIKRRDFGVGGASTVSDELEVTLSVHAIKS